MEQTRTVPDSSTPPARVRSVLIGQARPMPAKSGRSGIAKAPVSGPVEVRAPGPRGSSGIHSGGLSGDTIVDVDHHGGDDQAVYAYAREDLDTWAQELGVTLADGSFGENLTTVGLDITDARIGEQWRVGDHLLLQVTDPRIPCNTFAARMVQLGGPDRGWQRRFTRGGRPGSYLRVLQPGSIQSGDPVVVTHRPSHGVTVGTVFRALLDQPEMLPGVLPAAADLPAATLAGIRSTLAAREPSAPQ